MARAKAKNKAKKTMIKRIKASNPKGNRKPIYKYVKANQHHLKTGKSARAKRRKSGKAKVNKSIVNKYNLKK